MVSLGAVVARYNELRGQTHTGAAAFSAALTAHDPVEKLAMAMVAIGVNNALGRSGSIDKEDSAVIAAAMCKKIEEQMEGAERVLEYARVHL